MIAEMEALARRAVACPKWRWMMGARYWFSGTPDDCYRVVTTAQGESLRVRAGLDPLPDLADPATLGCLLALVRESWGDPLLHAEPEPDGTWRVWRRVRPMGMAGMGPTEAAALVAALEAAPC